MIRISLPYLYTLSAAFEPIENVRPNTRYGDSFFVLWTARQELEQLFNNSVFAPSLRSSRGTGEGLMAAIDRLTANSDMDRLLTQPELFAVTNGLAHFRTAFLAEIFTLPSYFVDQQGGFDVLTLLDHPLRTFPSSLVTKVPEAIFDVYEAAKALAYELPTSCGFHIFRVTESVLRRYYSEVTGSNPHPKVRNIAVYVNAMRQKKCGDEKILSAIKQFSDLHRNPLIHPEAALTMEEAIGTLGMSYSIVSSMLAVLPVPPQTTTTASASASASATSAAPGS